MARLVFAALALVLMTYTFSAEGATFRLPLSDEPALTLQQAHDKLIGNGNEAQKQCAKVGEYCLISDQCCSKRCLFYAAKCVT